MRKKQVLHNPLRNATTVILNECSFDLLYQVLNSLDKTTPASDVEIAEALGKLFVNGKQCEFLLNEEYVGVAKCHKEDTYDNEVGKEIAYHKARVTYEKDKYNKLHKYFNRIRKILDTLEEAQEQKVVKATKAKDDYVSKFK